LTELAPSDPDMTATTAPSSGSPRRPRAVASLAERWRDRWPATLYHVTGRRDVDDVLAERAAASIDEDHWRIVAFEPQMADVWDACDVAVCRAGATTVAELCTTGVPSVLVPLPNAPSAHQHANAAVLGDAGAAVVVEDDALTGELLDGLIVELLSDPDRLATMSAAARSLARSDAARRVAEVVLDHAR
jgi:UDP-N-acetylglucosamine--N-acetylmuramyl-(pentapeptide) pyrophosphoryl-undecaprenol N-acetylglucosamine transferase